MRRTELPSEIQVGDAVLLVGINGDLQAAEVTRVTKTQFRITTANGKEHGPFRHTDRNSEWLSDNEKEQFNHPIHYYEPIGGGRCWTKSHKVYYFTARQYLLHKQEKQKKAKQEKQAAEEERRQRIQEQHDKELVEAKEAVGGCYLTRQRMMDQMLDGSRYYVIDVPVKSEHKERKGDWERVTIHVKDNDRERFGGRRDDEQVEYNFTWTNGAEHSNFSSCSTCYAATDNDAIWEVIRKRYHDWS